MRPLTMVLEGSVAGGNAKLPIRELPHHGALRAAGVSGGRLGVAVVQHALFIALCRSRGIPCRLVYGSRMEPENAGKDHDPGYRCWPLFFAPGLGWVPLDISSADTATDGASQWFGGVDENRIEWAEGWNFQL